LLCEGKCVVTANFVRAKVAGNADAILVIKHA